MECCCVHKREPDDLVVALVGNPNVGKSTVFNALTGLNQHTGNWPGKTVAIAQGRFTYKGRGYVLVDLPGTYSLLSQSEEERVAAEFILSGQADCTVVLGDATCLERNLNLVLQILELTDRALLCVNLLDEAARHGVRVNLEALETELGIPVVGTAATTGTGLEVLREKLRQLGEGTLQAHPRRVLDPDQTARPLGDTAAAFVKRAEEIAARVLEQPNRETPQRLDRLALGRWSGRFLMLLLLFAVFWLTMVGANYPSRALQRLFDWLDGVLRPLLAAWPWWLSGLLLDGIYATVTRVVAVMLPPMAIFFPLFTLLEDFGYLPRVAFLTDHCFQRCGACGKQMLTMCMGFGCNAAGVTGCRIITSPRERLIAILTNAMVPCNGRFPAMIVLISVFFSENSFLAALLLALFVLLGVAMTFLASRLLHGTVLRGTPSDFILEMPPYRRPRVGQVLLRALLDRTVFVLGRAVLVAAPAGAFLWLCQQISVGDTGILTWAAAHLEPVGLFLGMNGAILLAFFLSFPANELLLPLVLLILNAGSLTTEAGVPLMRQVFLVNGWTWTTALCTILFLLFHWPCSTTCLTIHKETGSWTWTAAAMLLPTLFGVILCAIVGHIF